MGNQPNILVVDDEPANFDVIEILLFKEGYQLHYEESGVNALSCIPDLQPDIILLDVMMPDMDGIEVCQELKNNPRSQHIPVIIVTALNDKEDLARCLDAGADDFISKPINSNELRARVRSMLRIKAQYDCIQDTMRLREEMMQAIVHDLRNPLIGIMLGCDSIKTAALPERIQKRILQIGSSVEQMRALVDDILTIGRIEANKLVLNISTIDVAQITELAIADFTSLASSRSLQIISEFPPEPVYINGDIHLIRRVFANLLDNAIKFSPKKSIITVRVETVSKEPHRPKLVKIHFIDCGTGVSSEQKQIIFEKYQVGSIILGVSQIGLGLSFCKMTLEAHGGSIIVTNNQPQGAIFTVLLDEAN
jgi:signal transduction histidine kinase